MKRFKKVLSICLVVAVVMSVTTVTAFASASSPDMSDVGDALADAFGTVVTNIITVVVGILPVGLLIFSLSAVIGYSIKFFRQLIK